MALSVDQFETLKAAYLGLPDVLKEDINEKVIDILRKMPPAQQNMVMQVFADLWNPSKETSK